MGRPGRGTGQTSSHAIHVPSAALARPPNASYSVSGLASPDRASCFCFFEGVLGLLRFRFLGLVLSGLAGAPGCEGLDAARFGIGHGAGRASEGEAPDAAFVTPRPLVLGRTIATVGVAPRWRSLGNSS